MSKAFLFVDSQNDFMPGGALPIIGGDAIVPVVSMMQTVFDGLIVALQNRHPPRHLSYASQDPGRQLFERESFRAIAAASATRGLDVRASDPARALENLRECGVEVVESQALIADRLSLRRDDL